jgi:phage terminase small subunit
MMALTDKQKKFADEYLIDMNATAAYLRAGYKCSEAAARSSASDLLTNPNISEYIESKQKKLEIKTEVTAEWVIKEFIENHKLARDIGELSASNKALESIGRHLGMFNDKMRVDANNNNMNTDLTNLSPDERRARIDELNRRRGNGTARSS